MIESLGEERTIVVTAQVDPRLDAPKPGDLHTVGTLATVHKVVRMPNQSRFVFTEGVERVRLLRYSQTEPFMVAEVETLADTEPGTTSGVEALVRCGRLPRTSRSRAGWWTLWPPRCPS